MKTIRLLLRLWTLSLIIAVQAVWAQSGPTISIQTYDGLSITGAVGTVYTVQYTTDPAQSNGWRGAGIVQLPSSPYLWIDTGVPATVQRSYRTILGPTNLMWIPPGTFTMGSPTNELERWPEEGPQTVVTLTLGFFMCRHEVTQGEYAAVTGLNPSHFWGDLTRPVEFVSWYEAVAYCARLTTNEQTAGRLPLGYAYRLPTQAEWEYACRAGTATAYHYGPALRSGMANFQGMVEYDSSVGSTNNPAGIYLNRTTAVESYAPNGWGLYDMHGNVFEWCQDWWSASLPGGSITNPPGPSTGTYRILRGGSWEHNARFCRSADQGAAIPTSTYRFIGFRVVLATSP